MGYDSEGYWVDEDEQRSQGPKALRDALDAANKRLKELEKVNATLTGQVTQRNLKDVLAEKGLRPGLARVIAREDVDLSDPKAIDDWLSDTANQEDFGFSISAGEPAEAEGSDGADGGQAEYAADLATFQGASNGAMPASNAAFDQAREQILNAKTPADINAALAAARKQFTS